MKTKKFKVGDRVRINHDDPNSAYFKVEATIIKALDVCGENYYELDDELGEWNEEDLELAVPIFKVGDRVRIVNPPGGGNAGIMSVIVDTHKDAFGETIYALDGLNGKLSCVNWSSKYLELIPFEIGDYVKYKNGNTAYEISMISCDRINLKHLVTKKIYPESDPDKLIKLKFKIGDRVEVVRGSDKYLRVVSTITNVDCEGGIFYRLSDIKGVKLAERNLEFAIKQPETIPTFHKGDLVYVDPDKVESEENCYKFWRVIGEDIDKYGIECSGNGMRSIHLVKDCLKKPIFKKGQYISIGTKSWIIENIYFNVDDRLSYTIDNPEEGSIFYSEDELLQEISKNAVTICKVSDTIIAKADKNIINFDLEEENYGNKNQLQGEDSPKRARNDERGNRIYGRKPKSAIKVGHLDYQKVVGRSKS